MHSGKPVVHRNLSTEEHHAVLVGTGMPTGFADIFVDVEIAIERGDLAYTGGDLARLIGRPTTPLTDTLKAALQG